MRVIHYAGAGVMGGLLAHVAILARELVASGHDLLVALSPAPGVDGAAQACARGGARVERLTVEGKGDLRGMAALRRLVRGERPDIFHLHLSSPIESIPAILAARAGGARHIMTTEHAPTWFPLERWHSRAARKVAGRFVEKVIAVCRSDARFLRDSFGVPERRLAVILNGVPAPGAMPQRAAARERLGLPAAARPLVGYAGALEEKKGVLDLIEGAGRAGLPALALALAGDGPLAAALDRRAPELAFPLVRTGRIDRVETFLAAIDIFALPSHQEAMPLSLLEAMGAGLPIVASRVGGIPEAIEEGVTGLLIDPANPDQIGAALRRLHGDVGLAARLGSAARAAALERFSASRMAREVEALYREALGLATGGETACA